MIGSGVYLLPVTLASTGSSSVIGWGICGLGALTLALVFSGLGRFYPDADGLSDYTRRGLGRFAGYQTALFFWASCLVGNVAVAVAGTGYLAVFFPALKTPLWGTVCNLTLIWLMTGAYIVGTRVAARVGALTLLVGLVPIAMGVAAGVVAFSPETFAASWRPDDMPLAQSVPASLVVIFWAFLGVESAAVLSGSVKHPERDVGRASVAGVALALVVYVAGHRGGVRRHSGDRPGHIDQPLCRSRGAGVRRLGRGTRRGLRDAEGHGHDRRLHPAGRRDRAGGGGGGLHAAMVRRRRDAAPVQPPHQRRGHDRPDDRDGAAQPGRPVRRAGRGHLGACAWPSTPPAPSPCSGPRTASAGRSLAAVGFVFSLGAVVAAAAGYLLPTLIFFAVVSIGWLFMRKTAGPRVDPSAHPFSQRRRLLAGIRCKGRP